MTETSLIDHERPMRRRLCRLAILGASATAIAFMALGSGAQAATPTPGWTIHSFAMPSRFANSDNGECLSTLLPVSEFRSDAPNCDSYQITAVNAGSESTDGSAVTLSDVVPAGLVVRRVSFFWSGTAKLSAFFREHIFIESTDLNIALTRERASPVCTEIPTGGVSGPTTVQCTFPELGFTIRPDERLQMVIFTTVAPGAPAVLKNSATVSGGGAESVETAEESQVGDFSPAFGPSSLGFVVSDVEGRPYTQAAGHPYEITTRLELANEFRVPPDGALRTDTTSRDVKDVVVDLPLGMLGSAMAAPRCTFTALSAHITAGIGGCPPDTVVGQVLTEPQSSDSANAQIYNMVPEHGVAAEFAFVDQLAGPHVLYARVVPGPAGYVLQVTSNEVPQVQLADIVATFFGNPAAKQEELAKREGKEASGITPAPMFTNPAHCSGESLAASVHVDSWQSPGRHNADGTPDLSDPAWASASSRPEFPAVTGCNLLQFDPSMSVQTDTTAADSPTGLTFDLRLPQTEDPGTLATPPLRKAVVTLPPGLTVDPSAANGLGACSLAQIALGSASSPACPDSSKIGTVELTTPLLPGTLSGAVYLARQNENPFGSLLAGYIVVDDPDTGVVVKIPGELKLNEQTGQITGVFDNNPQFPFSELKLRFKGGPTGALATPESCGAFTTSSVLTPWSAPDSGLGATPSDSFAINSSCVNQFAPSFTAGTTNTKAGAYSPFVLSFSRSDTDQDLAGLTATLPPGLLAKIAGLPLCSDASLAAAASDPSGATEAAHPSCPAGSQVGTVQAGAGPGPNPYFTSGKAYLTGPYKGAPYGLAVVVPALAGPFDLGNVVVRTSLQIDPTDGHVTAVSDPFPTILKGIPLRLRRVDVTLDRANFTFNPTSCAPMAISGVLSSTGGLSAPVSSRFQASGCAELPFKPRFSASTQGRTSKANGASLKVKIAQSQGEADIGKVNVQLPIALPSRLTTLQKACTEAQFNANPAGCPEGSNVGTAVASTPVLNVPLVGPAYLVSHGAAAFPDLEFVLQGEGVKIVLDGKTDIKKGITYSRFETVPDAPISFFEASFPEGPHSILAANGNLCTPTKTVTVKRRVTIRAHGRVRHVLRSVKQSVAAPLQMPTRIVGQNGAVLQQTTKIAVDGCVKHVTKKKKAKKAAHARSHGGAQKGHKR